MRNKIQNIEDFSKEVFKAIFSPEIKALTNRIQKGHLYDLYTDMKTLLDSTQKTLSDILKKQITSNYEIGKLAAAITNYQVKKSM